MDLEVGGSSRYLETSVPFIHGARIGLPDEIQYTRLNLNFR